jgi:predicted lipoprotein with Yx(FWY)xxD motif
MNMNRHFAVVLVAGLAWGGTNAHAADVLTGKNGMTLYTFAPDANGKSACSGGCLAVWPAAKPGDAAGAGFADMTRDDGSKQLTYGGKPLYYFAKDEKPGDRKGDKVQNVWFVAVPGASKAETGPAARTSGSGY